MVPRLVHAEAEERNQLAQRRATQHSSRVQKTKASSSASAKSATKSAPTDSRANLGQPIDHSEHHELIARNLNALMENFQELRTEFRVLGREVQALHKRFEQVDADVSDVRKRLETVTSAVFDSDQTLRGVTSHIQELWGAAIDISGKHTALVETRKTRVEEAEHRRGTELERRLANLSNQSDTNK
jgi:uncharacterized protein YoxC